MISASPRNLWCMLKGSPKSIIWFNEEGGYKSSTPYVPNPTIPKDVKK